MSAKTVNVLDYQLRHMLQDYNPTAPVFTLPARLHALEKAFFWLEGKLPAQPTLSTSFITTVAGSYSYSSVATDLQSVNALRRQSDGGKVYRITPQLGLELRKGQTITSSDPEAVWFEESSAGVLTAYLYPTPNKVDILDAFREAGPTSFAAQSITASADLSLVSISAGVYGHDALVYRAAYELIHKASPEVVASLGLGNQAAQCFMQGYTDALQAESTRVLEFRRPSGIVRRGIR